MKLALLTLFTAFLPLAANASTCIVGAGSGQTSIVTVCDGKQIAEVDLGGWPDYLVQGTNALNALQAKGYKVVSQSGGENGLMYWTLQK